MAGKFKNKMSQPIGCGDSIKHRTRGTATIDNFSPSTGDVYARDKFGGLFHIRKDELADWGIRYV